MRIVDASEDSAMCDVHVDAEGMAIVSGSADSRVLVRCAALLHGLTRCKAAAAFKQSCESMGTNKLAKVFTART